MTGARWPHVVDWLLTTLPTLPDWSGVVEVFDTNPVSGTQAPSYAIVGKTSEDPTSGSYVRLTMPSTLVNETGTVRVSVVTRTGDVNASSEVRALGFALVAELEDAITLDQTLGGALGALGTVALTVDIQSTADRSGFAQTLVVSVNYASQT